MIECGHLACCCSNLNSRTLYLVHTALQANRIWMPPTVLRQSESRSVFVLGFTNLKRQICIYGSQQQACEVNQDFPVLRFCFSTCQVLYDINLLGWNPKWISFSHSSIFLRFKGAYVCLQWPRGESLGIQQTGFKSITGQHSNRQCTNSHVKRV